MTDLDRTIHNEDGDEFEILSPTDETYRGFYEAYRFFNEWLFGGLLPDCLITMQRSKRSRGYFAGERFV